MFAARLRGSPGVTPTVPRLASPLVTLADEEVGVGAGGSDDPSSVTPSSEIPAGEAPPGEVTPGEAC